MAVRFFVSHMFLSIAIFIVILNSIMYIYIYIDYLLRCLLCVLLASLLASDMAMMFHYIFLRPPSASSVRFEESSAADFASFGSDRLHSPHTGLEEARKWGATPRAQTDSMAAKRTLASLILRGPHPPCPSMGVL